MKIFAHRGASKEAPENSLAAFRTALELGVDALELDCYLHPVRGLVVTHDPENLNDPKIPTLQEVLELNGSATTGGAPIPIIFDIKAQKGLYRRAALAVAELAEKYLPPEKILLSSFFWRHLFALRRNFPQLPRALILKQKAFKLVPISFFDKLFSIQAIHLGVWWTDAALVAKWHRAGKKVHAWVVNHPDEIRRCLEMGVDGIFTDDPRLAKKIVAGVSAGK